MATTLMIQASQVGPDDSDVRQGLASLGLSLALKAPPHIGAGCTKRVADRVGELQSRPDGADEARRLNEKAVEAARRHDYAEAMTMLRRARTVAPHVEVLKKNQQSIAEAWLMNAIKSSDTDQMVEAMEALRTLGA